MWLKMFSVLLVLHSVLLTSLAGANKIRHKGKKVVFEGEDLSVSCRYSKFSFIKWTKDGVPVSHEDPSYKESKSVESNFEYFTTVLDITNAQPYHTGEYKCSPLSEGHQIYVLNENFVVGNYDTQRYKYLIVNRPLVLQCNTTLTGAYEFDWFKDGEPLENGDKYKIENNMLNIIKAVEKDVGLYTCLLNSSTITSDESMNATIDVVIPPYALFPSKSMNVVEGSALKSMCQLKGSPLPNATWVKGGVTIELNDRTNITVHHDETKDAYYSVLVISNAVPEDRGNYTCFVESPVGNATAFVFIRIKDKLAALWPFLGICAEVIVLCAVIFIYEKKRNKSEAEESDTDNSPETKNTSGHGKDSDVRHRK